MHISKLASERDFRDQKNGIWKLINLQTMSNPNYNIRFQIYGKAISYHQVTLNFHPKQKLLKVQNFHRPSFCELYPCIILRTFVHFTCVLCQTTIILYLWAEGSSENHSVNLFHDSPVICKGMTKPETFQNRTLNVAVHLTRQTT